MLWLGGGEFDLILILILIEVGAGWRLFYMEMKGNHPKKSLITLSGYVLYVYAIYLKWKGSSFMCPSHAISRSLEYKYRSYWSKEEGENPSMTAKDRNYISRPSVGFEINFLVPYPWLHFGVFILIIFHSLTIGAICTFYNKWLEL